MPIEMPKGLPFSVDTWTAPSSRKRYHFLTHAHKDHLAGIASNSSYPIYSTRLTKIFALRHFPKIEESLFVEIEVGEKVVMDDPDGPFSVTAFDANHCPGAAMFLFEGEFGNILHTGDCRLTPDCLQCLPMKYITRKGRDNLCPLDYLILDCTFVRCSLKIPSKQSAIQQVINCIWKHPSAPVVYLACDTLGQEEILVEVSRTFGSKIYVDKTNNSECFHALSLVAPEILSQDLSSRFQVIEGFPRLNDRATQKLAEACTKLQVAPLFIRPSAQWYAGNERLALTQLKKPGISEAVMDEFGIWHVCFSIHSSREELEWGLQLLQPKWVISSTPPCRAMELDYVKNHCFKTEITAEDPLWKLLKVGPGKFVTLSSSSGSDTVKNVNAASVVRVTITSEEADRFPLKELSANNSELQLDLCPRSNITLFGRARLGLQDADLLQDDYKSEHSYENQSEVKTITDQALIMKQGNIVILSVEKSDEADVEKSDGKGNDEREMPSIGSCKNSGKISESSEVDLREDTSCCGSSMNLDKSLRKLYRSMNVPVPRPLPSLVELMDASKRVKVGSGFYYNRRKYYNSSVE